MPELVEVEIACRFLRRLCAGKRIVAVSAVEAGGGPRHGLVDDIVIEGTTGKAIEKALTGAKFVDMQRKGKYMWWVLDRKPWLTCHFGMTGRFAIRGQGCPGYVRSKEDAADVWPPKFTKLHVDFDDGTQLAYVNVRRLGRIGLSDDPVGTQPISLLGMDPLQDFPLPAFAAKLAQRNAPIKAAILDQSITAGVGNWIADESLYQSRLHPALPCSALTHEQIIKFGVEHEDYKDYPVDWLFHYRWSKGKGPQKTYEGHPIKFMTVGGRTSAVVEAVQGTGTIASSRRVQAAGDSSSSSTGKSTKAKGAAEVEGAAAAAATDDGGVGSSRAKKKGGVKKRAGKGGATSSATPATAESALATIAADVKIETPNAAAQPTVSSSSSSSSKSGRGSRNKASSSAAAGAVVKAEHPLIDYVPTVVELRGLWPRTKIGKAAAAKRASSTDGSGIGRQKKRAGSVKVEASSVATVGASVKPPADVDDDVTPRRRSMRVKAEPKS